MKKTPPTSAAELLDLLADGLHVKRNWSEADRAALCRWVAGSVPGEAIRERIALQIVQHALRPAVTGVLDETFRQELIEAAGAGLLCAARHFESGNRFGWQYALATTIAVVARYFDVPLLIRQGESAATAPDWLFSLSSFPTTHAVVAQVKHALREQFDDDNRIRKDIDALQRGRSQQATVDEIQRLLNARRLRRSLAMPVSFELLIEQVAVQLDVDLLTRIWMLTMAERARERLSSVAPDELFAALRGHLFESVERSFHVDGTNAAIT